MLLRITHETHYRYAKPIDGAQHILHLRPVRTPLQQLMAHALTLDPQPDSRAQRVDIFGNHQEWLAIQHAHSALRVLAKSDVRTSPPQEAPSTITWEDARHALSYRAGAHYDAAAGYAFPSPHVGCHAEFVDYAAPSFTPGRPLLAAALDLMARMHRDFAYRSGSSSIDTPARESLRLRQGVCQDFTHVMLACFRSLGLSARYVSGYMLTQPPPGQPRLIGADATHAWVQVYLPDLQQTIDLDRALSTTAQEDRVVARMGGWFDLCPTNARAGWGSPGEDYVRLAVGRDFSDVSPVRGVIFGGAEHSLRVAVTVEPMPLLLQRP